MTLPTSVPNMKRKFYADGQQQSVVIQLGQLALSDIVLSDLMTQAATLISQMLAVDYVSIWGMDAHHKIVSLQASIGWKQGTTDDIRKPLQPNSLEDFTITSQYPIIIENLNEETRFSASELMLEQNLVSGVSMLIGMLEKPLGVLEVFSRQVQIFSQDDCLFLQSIANILGLAMHRKRVEFQSNTRSGHEWDLYEIKHRLSEGRERERIRLAQELHDVPIQDLYGLIYQMDDLKDIVRDPDGERILDEHTLILNRIVNSLRAICRDLRPPSLSPFGLEVAIRDHVEKLRDQNPHINIHLELMPDKQLLSDSLRLNLFRFYQQAISNVLRHSEAADVYIRFQWDEEIIILEIEDNGKGFIVPKSWVELVRKDHFGLVGLAERVEGIRGKLEIVSAPGEGTRIRAIVPRYE
jgi:signal transduction histidine kinase